MTAARSAWADGNPLRARRRATGIGMGRQGRGEIGRRGVPRKRTNGGTRRRRAAHAGADAPAELAQAAEG